MKQNIPLVIDLYDIRLSKNDWKQIVESSVRLLLYENGDYGLRHIFIEEAAEFVPQRVGPDQGRVYAEIEKLARMGGNALLGYTLINQRAEEVNKAVLELCDCLFLHRQKGRNSLTALGKWLDIGSDMLDTKPIIQSLPTLPQGECYIWPAGTERPARVKIPQKNTFHPDRRATKTTASQNKDYKALDVSGFVSQMASTLETHIQTARENDPAELKRRIKQLEKQAREKSAAIQTEIREITVLSSAQTEALEQIMRDGQSLVDRCRESAEALRVEGDRIAKTLQETTSALKGFQSRPAIFSKPIQNIASRPQRQKERVETAAMDGLSAPQQRVLDAIAWMESVHLFNPKRTIVAFLSEQSPRSSGFKNNLSALRSMGLIAYSGSDSIAFTERGRATANPTPKIATTEELQRAILSRLPRPQSKILEALIEAYPDSMLRIDVAEASRQSPNSSGFKNNLSALRSLGVIEYEGSQSVKALSVLFLE
jgi:hypothetical protein